MKLQILLLDFLCLRLIDLHYRFHSKKYFIILGTHLTENHLLTKSYSEYCSFF